MYYGTRFIYVYLNETCGCNVYRKKKDKLRCELIQKIQSTEITSGLYCICSRFYDFITGKVFKSANTYLCSNQTFKCHFLHDDFFQAG